MGYEERQDGRIYCSVKGDDAWKYLGETRF